jgi:hypothetical protein
MVAGIGGSTMVMSRTGFNWPVKQHLSTHDMLRLASDFAEEHGADACDYAYRAVLSFEAEGEGERAYFWFLLLVMLSDIASHRLDPEAAVSIH